MMATNVTAETIPALIQRLEEQEAEATLLMEAANEKEYQGLPAYRATMKAQSIRESIHTLKTVLDGYKQDDEKLQAFIRVTTGRHAHDVEQASHTLNTADRTMFRGSSEGYAVVLEELKAMGFSTAGV